MFFSTFAAVAALASSAVVSAVDHKVVVGGTAGLVYTPNQIVAAVGDTVSFEFQSKNHTVTQSAFATPCNMLVNATSNQMGFNSGFVPVTANATEFPVWTVQVTAATPIWFYCQQTGHCAQGMVGAINAPTNGTKTFAAFQALAMGGASNSTTSASGSASGAAGAAGAGTTNNAGIGASASAGATDPAASSGSTAASGASSVKVASTGLSLGLVAAGLFLLA